MDDDDKLITQSNTKMKKRGVTRRSASCYMIRNSSYCFRANNLFTCRFTFLAPSSISFHLPRSESIRTRACRAAEEEEIPLTSSYKRLPIRRSSSGNRMRTS